MVHQNFIFDALFLNVSVLREEAMEWRLSQDRELLETILRSLLQL